MEESRGRPERPGGGTSPTSIRVFLPDDHEVVRRGVRELSETEDDIGVVAEASTASEAIAAVPALHPDVAAATNDTERR